jgi:hypothetical protein
MSKMGLKRIPLFLVICFLFSLASTDVVWAGFGISPPYVKNNSLTRGSYYEKKIHLGRGQPGEELRIEVTINVPGANDWISIDKGNSFTLAEGERLTEMIVRVNVPRDAPFGSYKGHIRVKTIPVGLSEGGGVAIIMGAQIDVDLEVKDIQIFDFQVRNVEIYNLEEGHKFWWLYFPGKIKFEMQIENLGNIKAAPTKVLLDIYDNQKKELLESLGTSKMEKIEPFKIQTIIAEFPTKLPAGNYLAKFQIFKKDEVVSEGNLNLVILPYGTLPGYKGYGFSGLSTENKASVIGVILVILTVVSFGLWRGYKIWRKKFKA